jgi:tetratricopeptide (TPR) repeat protein
MRFFLLVFFASEVAIGAASAQQPENWDWCIGRHNPTFEQRIGACTAIIELDGETPANRAKAFGNRGVAYINNGNVDLAVRDYEESLRLDSTSASSHHFRGNKYQAEKNQDAALAEFNEAIRLDPTDVFSLTNRGSQFLVRKDYDRAIADYNEAIRLDPEWTIAYYGRGKVYDATKQYDRAIADFDEAVRLNPRFVSAFMARGTVHQARSEFPQAIVDYDQVIRFTPKSTGALYNRGVAHQAIKDYDDAIADFSDVIKLNPGYTNAYLNRGMAYRAKGDQSRAIADYDQAIRLDPSSANAYFNRGNAYFAQKQYARAADDYSDAIRLNPKFAVAYAARGQIYSHYQEYLHAIADYDAATQIDPSLAVAYSGRCGDRIAAGQDLHAALSDCNESLRLQPQQVPASMHRAFIQLRLGNVTRARADFDAVLAIEANQVWSLYGRGLAKWENGDGPGAQSDITAAKKIRPDIVDAVKKYYGVTPQHDLLSRLAVADTQEHPMVFVIAHGDDGTCGPGCNEWIAADGSFDQGVDKRFRAFLGTLKGREPPIFFNSTGGFMDNAFNVGRMLRERKMAAGVGITIPDDCPADKVRDESCRQKLRESRTLKAQLRSAGAICYSACVYAFMGASVRHIAEGARVGVHVPIRPEPKSRRAAVELEDRNRTVRRQYAKQMGIDLGLVELADGTPYLNMHVLTRDEIARFLETPRP